MLNFIEFTKLDEKLIVLGNKAYPKFNNIVILGEGVGCFDEDTLIHTETGYKKICKIVKGENVWTLNEATKERELKLVQDVLKFVSHIDNILELTFDNGETVICTENHEFLIDDTWIKAKNINVNKKVVPTRTVYNLSILDNHNYEITKSNITVHNSGKGFITDNLLGIEGKILDVDALKKIISDYTKNYS